MNHRISAVLAGLCACFLSLGVSADGSASSVPMTPGNAHTFYIQAQVGDLEAMAFMVDTGSGYMTINEQTLADLKTHDQAVYLRELRGVLADGSEIRVPIYRLASLSIGGCRLHDVETAVFPGKTRQILGLNALKQVGSFTFSFDPPQLVLGRCPRADLLAAESP